MTEYACPHCKKPIYDDDALLCLYCGESLNRGIGKRKLIISIIAILVLVSFVLILIR